MELKQLFEKLYFASTEDEVERIIQSYPEFAIAANWSPLGGDQSYFGVVRNQQSNPIAALVEKITNSIDALLMKKCLEANIDPKSSLAPKTMEEAIKAFFPESKHWDLSGHRRQQAEEIQIIADGPTRNTSVIIYDNG